MNVQIRIPILESRTNAAASRPKLSEMTAARRRSAELHSISIARNCRKPRKFYGPRLCAEHQPQHAGISRRDALRLGLRPQPRSVLVAAAPRCAVSQICNLRHVAKGQPVGPVRRPAEYNSAIQQIENLRCFGRVSPLHAQRCSATRSAKLHSISINPNRRGARRFCGARLCEPQQVGGDPRVGIIKRLGGEPSCCGSQTRAPLVAAAPRCAASQICNLRHVAKGQRVGPVQHSAESNSAIQQIENLRYEASRAGPSPCASFEFRVSDFFRNSVLKLRILHFCHT
jgi:hypothetical protein